MGTSAERVRKHRRQKFINDFCEDYLSGNAVCTPDEFVEAKEFQFCEKHGVGNVSFNQSEVNDFYSQCRDLPEMDEDAYKVEDLLDLWADLTN
ncbi:hypothetical protein EZV61_03485 [Corallincola luteus]|uniref:Uncharacterized protein n=1 Tax=Corallincola luteus TaxID=1775177 RepID=A0ABY2APA9_9GAMM|nr:hypothetical protein [Corallincola luteus]TCI05039.1 hypothetical protein EZV61_03485 [Corallincola luteus]